MKSNAGLGLKNSFDRLVAMMLIISLVISLLGYDGLINVRAEEGAVISDASSAYGTEVYAEEGNYSVEGNLISVKVYSTLNDGNGDLAVISGTGKISSSFYDYLLSQYIANVNPEELIANFRKIIIGEGITDIGIVFSQYFLRTEEVELPSTLTSIEDRAFENCYALRKINIADNIVSIGASAFNSCASLNDLVVGSASKLKTIGSNAFYGCTSLADKDLFVNCHNLTSILGANTFTGTAYSGDIIMPQSLITLEAFNYCSDQIDSFCVSSASSELPVSPAKLVMKYSIDDNQARITYIKRWDSSVTSLTLPTAIWGAPVTSVDPQYWHSPVDINCIEHNIVDHTCQICGESTKCGDETYYEYADGVLSICLVDLGFLNNDLPPWTLFKNVISKVIIVGNIHTWVICIC
jgi:hypothetical protein